MSSNRMYFLAAALLAAMACHSPSGEKKGKAAGDSLIMIPTDTMVQLTDTMIHLTDTTITPALVESWKSFEQFNGKYAADVRLLQHRTLRQRFKQLLGADEAAFMQRFMVTPPIEVESGVLFNEGCKPHNCTLEEAAIAIDMKRDIIYAGIARNKIVQLYGERGDTSYPYKLVTWMEKFEDKPE
ncbi:hypothetical protein ACWKWU_16780 [Chitinophaga lutea]